MAAILQLDIEIHDKEDGSQARYLVHGYEDVLWTDIPLQAVIFLKDEIEKFEKENLISSR